MTSANSEQKANTGDAETLTPFGEVLNRNISKLIEVRREEEKEKGLQERIADAITCFTGSMTFVYIHLIGFGLWIVINLGWTPLKKFDPSFVVLAMFASVEAIFLSTFVLISQNRMAAAAERRAELDLQISLLAEHEITQVLTLMDEMARHMGLPRPPDPHLEESKSDVDPAIVLEAIGKKEKSVQESEARA